MAEGLSGYEAALAEIRASGLEHPDGQLLESVVEASVNRDRAAAYLLNASTHTSNLRAFLAEWKRIIAMFMRDAGVRTARDRRVVTSVTERDGGKCCITGMPGSFWDPLVVVAILPRMQLAGLATSSCREMLGAFPTPELRERLLSHIAEGNSFDRVENHWLLRKSAAGAFAQGHFQLVFKKRSKYEVLKNWTGGPHFPPILDKVDDFRPASFVDCSSSNINTPNRFALEILSHFATPLRWTYISQDIAGKRRKQRRASLPLPFSSILSFLSETYTAISRTVWLCMPTSMRIRTYRSLESLGARIYGFTDSPNVQQLPFGLYLKSVSLARRNSLVNEHATLELVRRHTDMPAPRVLDLVSDSTDIYLLTTRVPGYKLGLCLDSMSDQDTAILVRDLGRHLAALREIPRPQGWKHGIANTADGPCFDYRINAALDEDEDRGEMVGPFLTENDFNETLRCGALPDVVHRAGHKIVFTHGDLNMRNVLVDEHGRLSGIVDWENAGWFPEYWDYTKAFFVTKLGRRWLKMVDDMFGQFGYFRGELETEKELWNYCF